MASNMQKLVEPLSARELELDEYVSHMHSGLSIFGLAVYGVELAIGVVLLVLEWDDPSNFIFQPFMILRLCAYVYLMWATWSDLLEFEPSHPGLHIIWTSIHTVTTSALALSIEFRFQTLQPIYLLVVAIVENMLMLATWVLLRSQRKAIEELVGKGDITRIHPNTWRYLQFLPPADAPGEDRSARQLLWQTAKVFEDVRMDVVGGSGLEQHALPMANEPLPHGLEAKPGSDDQMPQEAKGPGGDVGELHGLAHDPNSELPDGENNRHILRL